MSRKSQEEMLMEWLEIPLSSDDDLECFSDDSIQDETYVAPESVDCDSDSSDEESQVPVIRTEDVSGTRQSDVIMKESTSQLSDNALKLPCSSKNVTKNSRSVVWKDKQLIIPELQSKFHGNTSLPEEVINLNTPYQFFKHIFPSKLFDLIVKESHRYSVQCNPDRPIDLSCDDIKKFIGICLVMSIVHVPNSRDYWGEVTGTHLIKTTMTVNQYEQIHKFLHFNDNSAMIPRGENGHDRLFKIRPIIELMRSRFQTIPVEECVSVDEQICSTKARSYLKQYMPNKPHKYGYKLFVISGISGYAYDFEIFTGDENEPEKRVTGEEDLGASANVVVRLSRILPRNMNHKLYCDNYHTSLPLLVWLHKQGIYSLGTVRRNRVPDCKLPSEAELKKMARGASVERVATVDGVDISNVVWKDNKSVMLLSTLAGQQPIHEAGRADYWKSQAKKFCKFCKCWIADNKPSIEFHEGGSRHKENVAKRISEISKKSREEYESNKNIDNEMKKMEEAAMKAYLKDVEAEADYTSKIIKEKAMQKNLEEGGTSEEKELVDIAFRVKESAETAETEKKEEKKVWWEAKSDEGHTYYWNTESGESVWEPPEDGYVSLAEQKEETKRAEKAAKRKKATDEMKKKEEEKQISEEKQARIQREKMKEIYGRKEKEEAKEKPKMSAPIGPAPRVDPYGSWKVIEKKEFKPVDLQLPEQEFIPIKVPTLTEEPKVKFKEKTVATGTIVTDDDDEVSVSGFKKRKAAPGVKRNMRQRLDED